MSHLDLYFDKDGVQLSANSFHALSYKSWKRDTTMSSIECNAWQLSPIVATLVRHYALQSKTPNDKYNHAAQHLMRHMSARFSTETQLQFLILRIIHPTSTDINMPIHVIAVGHGNRCINGFLDAMHIRRLARFDGLTEQERARYAKILAKRPSSIEIMDSWVESDWSTTFATEFGLDRTKAVVDTKSMLRKQKREREAKEPAKAADMPGITS